MSEKILWVDDEPEVLEGFQRTLRKHYRLDTALGGEEGLRNLAEQGPYAVVVSDMRMPGMDGIQFLAQVRKLAPDSVRLMLTGNADLQTAIHAVNEGSIFRFLTKPCAPEALNGALTAAIQQHRLVMAEKELLERTLRGSIHVLTEVLSLVNPTAFGRAARMRPLVEELAAHLKIPNAWEIEVACMLSQVGCVTVPEETLLKLHKGAPLSMEELRMYQEHPQVGCGLINQIPRLEGAARVIAYQEKRFDGTGLPHDSVHGLDIPMGARVLKLAMDFDKLVSSGFSRSDAAAEIERRDGWYDPAVVAALKVITSASSGQQMVGTKKVRDLELGMVLAEDVCSFKGVLMVSKGQQVTAALRARLVNMLDNQSIPEALSVLI